MRPKLAHLWVNVAWVLMLASCNDPASDPCEGVACSDRGTCVAVGSSPQCQCEQGYQPSGLACLPAESEGDGDLDGDTDIDADNDPDRDSVADGSTDADVDADCDGDLDNDAGSDSDGDFDGDVPGDWVTVLAGTFTMGSPAGEEGRHDDESPHEVALTRDFEIQATEVTQAQFELVMGYDPSWFVGCPRCPVEQVTWYEAAAYCNALSEIAGRSSCYECSGSDASVECEPSGSYAAPYDCPGYRLPTEAEWEYAARSGTTGARYGDIDNVAWYEGNSDDRTHEVGTLDASPWGLYDMLGNVWEWCHDWKGDYSRDSVTDPFGPEAGSARVGRGGSLYDSASVIRAATRSGGVPGGRSAAFGFRPVRSLGM